MNAARTHSQIERLEAAARGAGLALVCPHQSSDEFHGALVRDYLNRHTNGASFYAVTIAVLAAVGAIAIL